MSDEKKPEKTPDAPAAPKKGSSGAIVVIVAAVLSLAGSVAGGAVIAPLVAAKMHTASKPAGEEGDDKGEKEDLPGETMAIDPIVVDVRDESGTIHHLRVGFALELSKPIPEEEFKRLVPRVRDAALEYVRTIKVEDAGNPAKFDAIKGELSERIFRAFGKSRVKRILITDFVLQ